MDRGEEKWEGGINLLPRCTSKLGCALRSAMHGNAESLTMRCDTDKRTRREGFVPREIARTHATAFPSRLGSVALEILRRNSVTSTLLREISEYAASRYDNSQVSPPLARAITPEVNGKGTTMKTDRTQNWKSVHATGKTIATRRGHSQLFQRCNVCQRRQCHAAEQNTTVAVTLAPTCVVASFGGRFDGCEPCPIAGRDAYANKRIAVAVSPIGGPLAAGIVRNRKNS
ncbi:hypothetical protein G5I_14055 [Acromyrmex echinatior]|uniref:Uncharacterized protein n=1 Tax=Acromyrmex echinatior TaxID=103372 RepID=F4X6T6_ACREC|nr:hypothetical protein G5I_14055 [Acromyrmex echinatior]